MSLVAFHKLLIGAAIIFCFGFAGWEIREYLNEGSVGQCLLGILFVALGIGLIVYLRRLNRILGYERNRR